MLTLFSAIRKSFLPADVGRKDVQFVIVVSLCLIALMAFSFNAPAATRAHPLPGLTPTITPMPTPTLENPPTPTPTPTKEKEDNGDEFPIDVSLNCNLACPTEGEVRQVSVPVILVHRGSDWIAETTISNTGVTRLVVPYPGEWEVFMTGPPQLNESVDVIYPNTYPVLLGMVVANGGAQSVDCPFALQEDACAEIPDLLPTTGTDGSNSTPISPISLLGRLIVLVLIINGFTRFIKRSAIF